MLAIYKNSRNSAWQSHEEDLWLASRNENVACKNAIDTAIKEISLEEVEGFVFGEM